MDTRDWIKNYNKYSLEMEILKFNESNPERLALLEREKTLIDMVINGMEFDDQRLMDGLIRHKYSYRRMAYELCIAKSTVYDRTKKAIDFMVEMLENQ